jgi:hypothetical protein
VVACYCCACRSRSDVHYLPRLVLPYLQGCVPLMSKYRNKQVFIEATQWFSNGDHPDDRYGRPEWDLISLTSYIRLEGKIVRFFRRPEEAYSGRKIHPICGNTYHEHGWIESTDCMVCPGDWVITGTSGQYTTCKPDVFANRYELVEREEFDRRPHSRACGIKIHDHGPSCSSNCPTCGGQGNR